MSPLILKIVKAAWRARGSQFWLIWIMLTASAAAFVNAFVNGPTFPSQAKPVPSRRPPYSRPFVVLGLLGLFLACYVGSTLAWEDFDYYDNSMFTLQTLRSQNIAPAIWRGEGRFFPLGHQEFNFVRHLTSTAVGYHAVPIVELLLLCCVLVVLDDEIGLNARAVLACCVLITPTALVSFGQLIFTERNVMVFVALLALSVRKFEMDSPKAWAVAAAICAQFALYYKEVAFLIILGFSVSRIVMRAWERNSGRWYADWLRSRESQLDACLAGLSIIFLLYYFAAMLPHPSMHYAEESRWALARVISSYLRADPLLWVFIPCLCARAYRIIQRRTTPVLLWDGLAFGGFLYALSYFYLRMFAAYYMAPVDMIAVLYVGRFVILRWPSWSLARKVPAAAALLAVLVMVLALSADCFFEQKNVVREKAELAGLIEQHYQQDPASIRRLYFPFANPALVMEFGAYLNYRNLPIEGSAVSSRSDSIALVSATVANDGPCVDYEPILCHKATAPEDGDWIVVLPDDEASLAEASPYRAPSYLLASFQPRPSLPTWLQPLVRTLRIATPHALQRDVPNRWLDASVAVWKS